MTRRRPGSREDASAQARRPIVGQHPGDRSTAAWYVALIGAVLLIATAIYALSLYRQVEAWREAADQLTIGQELLRADRDEILQKARETEAAVATLESVRDQNRARLEGLEDQRRRLQEDVVGLTQTLAENEKRTSGAAVDPGRTAAFDRLERERDRLVRELDGRQGAIERLTSTLSEKEQALADQAETLGEAEALIEKLRAEKTALDAEKTALEQDEERARQELALRRESARVRQIVRGHRASLGEVRPYIAEVGPEDWRVIESWLALQLRRPMAVPDLSAHGWSYEGARLLGTADGTPMAMLLYADAEERPASLTIARDATGERPLDISEEGGLRILDWREERHAFVLAGEAGKEELEAVAIALQNQPPMLSEDAVVPTSRYVRPSFRPANGSE